MRSKLVLLILTLSYLGISSQNRILQWNDPNCSEWSSDGLTCLKCDVRAYYDTVDKKCYRVDDLCKTWSETNG